MFKRIVEECTSACNNNSVELTLGWVGGKFLPGFHFGSRAIWFPGSFFFRWGEMEFPRSLLPGDAVLATWTTVVDSRDWANIDDGLARSVFRQLGVLTWVALLWQLSSPRKHLKEPWD